MCNNNNNIHYNMRKETDNAIIHATFLVETIGINFFFKEKLRITLIALWHIFYFSTV